ncbi:hypothetical protein [Polaribacter sp. SA4-12]|uniref:hypothetical protein n=1 Tax=Polaribacter sp. SA4-12 TaxID=1312072 RepID=UPI000B3BEAA6|nr:hypothetical protein [Polaribacter sp. SA4-12]ARV15176.1 hypothetical protein BTO07_08455 [Polaribacter sp. SA4-12]
MESIKKISIVLIFLFSFLMNAQAEKSSSYFSNQLKYNTQQLQGSTTGDLQCESQQTISTISLKQIGNENFVNIEDNYASGDHTVYQIGDRNNYQFINYRNNQSVNLGVLQTGDGNLLKITGTNTMFQNLIISQFGGAKMSIINY